MSSSLSDHRDNRGSIVVQIELHLFRVFRFTVVETIVKDREKKKRKNNGVAASPVAKTLQFFHPFLPVSVQTMNWTVHRINYTHLTNFFSEVSTELFEQFSFTFFLQRGFEFQVFKYFERRSNRQIDGSFAILTRHDALHLNS